MQLAKLAKSIQSDLPNIDSIKIIGHADRLGNDDINTPLSLARANTIRDSLMATFASQGIQPGRFAIETSGMGASQPVKLCPGNPTVAVIACLQDNRRVEIEVTGVAMTSAQNNEKNTISKSIEQKTSLLSESVHNLNAPERNPTVKWAPILVNAKP